MNDTEVRMDELPVGGDHIEAAVEAAACAIGGFTPKWYRRWRYTSNVQLAHDQAVAALTAAFPLLAARVRGEALAAIDRTVQGEMDLHQCSFDELPKANQHFVQGMRRAREQVAASPVTAS